VAGLQSSWIKAEHWVLPVQQQPTCKEWFASICKLVVAAIATLIKSNLSSSE